MTGATRTADAKELLYARQKIVTCAKAYKLQAIDMVHIDLKGMSVYMYVLICKTCLCNEIKNALNSMYCLSMIPIHLLIKSGI